VIKSLEEFDFSHAKTIPKQLILSLLNLKFIGEKKNVILIGPPGTGNYRKILFMERSSEKGTGFGYPLIKIFP
jgi:hypothetical protein